MPRSDAEFHALMQRVLDGSEEAAQELFRDYERYLLQVIRRRLDRRMRSKFDSLDFAQDVWASFFAHEQQQRVFQNSAELLAFLAQLARNKVYDGTRQRTQVQKNDVERERSLDDSQAFDKNELVARQPTPSQVMSKEEEWLAFLRKQPLVYQRVFVLLREGQSQLEIADELGLSPRTINRIANRLTPGMMP